MYLFRLAGRDDRRTNNVPEVKRPERRRRRELNECAADEGTIRRRALKNQQEVFEQARLPNERRAFPLDPSKDGSHPLRRRRLEWNLIQCLALFERRGLARKAHRSVERFRLVEDRSGDSDGRLRLPIPDRGGFRRPRQELRIERDAQLTGDGMRHGITIQVIQATVFRITRNGDGWSARHQPIDCQQQFLGATLDLRDKCSVRLALEGRVVQRRLGIGGAQPEVCQFGRELGRRELRFQRKRFQPVGENIHILLSMEWPGKLDTQEAGSWRPELERAIGSGRCAIDALGYGIHQLHLRGWHWLAVVPSDDTADHNLDAGLSDHPRGRRAESAGCNRDECKQQGQACRAR